MALKEEKKPTEGRSPAWLTLLFFAGAIALYLGRRVVVQWETASLSLVGVGVAAMLVATALRFAPMFRPRGQASEIARMMDGLQVLGLVAVGLFFATTEAGVTALGLGGKERETAVAAIDVTWLILLTVSITGLSFAELALRPMRDAAHLEGKRVREAAVSGMSLALAACYCSLLVYAAAQQEAQADFSYFKTSEPGEATVKLLEKAAEPVVVTAFFPTVSEVRKEVSGYLAKLSERTGNLEYKLVDRLLEPGLADDLKVVSDGSVVLSRGDSRQTLMVGTKLAKARQKLVKFDGEFHEKLLKLLERKRTVYLTTGHGELNESRSDDERAEGRSADLVKRLLEQNNYRVRDLGLSDGLGSAVPDDADVVLVLGPTQPFAPEEIATLKRYADAGGKLLMALDADAVVASNRVGGEAPDLPVGSGAGEQPAAAPGAQPAGAADAQPAAAASADAAAGEAAKPAAAWLEELAESVGMKFVPTVLADERNHVVARNDPSDRVILPTNRFSSHASVSTLSRSSARAGVVVLGASYLSEAGPAAGGPTVTLRSLPTVFNDDDRNFSMSQGEERKSYNLAMAIEREVTSERAPNDPPEGADTQADAGAQETKASDTEAAPKDAEEGAADDAKKATAKDTADSNEKADSDKNADGEEKEAPRLRGFVVADADVFSDLLMSRAVGNQMLMVDAMRWLIGEESLAGELESEEDVAIEQTKQEDLAWFYGTIFGVPGLVLGAGLWTSRRMRRPKRRASDESGRQAKARQRDEDQRDEDQPRKGGEK